LNNIASAQFDGKIEDEYGLYSIAEIMNGSGNRPGLCNLIDSYLDEESMEESTRTKLKDQVNFIRQRATGEIITGATWIRNFVRNHPAYKFDSVVTPEINHDLLKTFSKLKAEDFYVVKQ
jgi:glutamate--cysteine ligase catalytic subunit